jgi:N,N'-diacetyllegionaminate synthase
MDRMVTDFKIGKSVIGANHPCLIIAEAGVNHNGDLAVARDMVQVAAHCGADAIKFQTFKAEKLATVNAPKASYQAKTTGNDENQLEMLRKLELSESDFHELFKECLKNNILFLSTPFDEGSADFLAGLNVEGFKISSGDLTNLPFLKHVAKIGKPVILSTGMSYLNEVDEAVQTIHATGNHKLALLHCTSNYPANPAGINLRAMNTLAQTFHLPVGLSDHSEGIEIAFAAVAMGATIIEKHFTLDRNMAGPDQHTSLEPRELEAMVKGIRKVELALGNGIKEPADGETDTAAVARKSVVARIPIPTGTRITGSHLAIMRPGTGLPPVMLSTLLGRTTRVDIPAGTLITLEMLE